MKFMLAYEAKVDEVAPWPHSDYIYLRFEGRSYLDQGGRRVVLIMHPDEVAVLRAELDKLLPEDTVLKKCLPLSQG